MKKTILKLSILGILTVTTLIEANACRIGGYPLESEILKVSPKGTLILTQNMKTYTNYMRITKADELHAKGANGENTKAIIIDGYLNKNHGAFSNNLTESTMPGNYLYDCGTSHGTHITGIVKNIAPQTKIKFIERCDLKLALMNAATSEGDIVNTSFKWSDIVNSPSLQDALQAITDSGKIIFKSFGNCSNKEPHYIIDLIRLTNNPRYKGRIVLVSNTSYTSRDQERLSSHSDYATIETSNALCAPGKKIYAPVESGYGLKSGTSMASPNAAGNFLLLKSLLIQQFGFDFFSNDEILSFIKESARTQSINGSFVFGPRYGNGVIDVNAAYELACQAVPTKHRLKELTMTLSQLKKVPESEKNIYNKELKLDELINEFHFINQTEINKEETQFQGGFLTNMTQTFWNFFI